MALALIEPTSDEHGAPAPRAGASSAGDRAAGALGNIANRSSDEAVRKVQGRKSKRFRYELRSRLLWRESTLDRVRACGRVSRSEGGAVGARCEAGQVGFSGLTHCGSVWACPVCAARVARERAMELSEVLSWAVCEGHTVAMVTLTLRHQKGDRLRTTWDAMSAAWSDVTSGRFWAGESEAEYVERLAAHGNKIRDWQNAEMRAYEADLCAAAVRDEGLRQAYGDEAEAWRLGLRRPRPVTTRHVGAVERYGILGFVRAVEVTNGENGWHPHIHALLVLEGKVPSEAVARLGDEMFTVWKRRLEAGADEESESEYVERLMKHGERLRDWQTAKRYQREALMSGDEDEAKFWGRWQRPTPPKRRSRRGGFTPDKHNGGLDVKTTAGAIERDLAEYLAKSLSLEATHGHAKKGRSGSRTPFQILADVERIGDADDLAKWWEWEKASHGRRQLTWSSGLRRLAGLAEEQRTDQEIAEDEIGEDDLFVMPAETWEQVRDEQVGLLIAMEDGGLRGGLAWLDSRSLPYLLTPSGRIRLGGGNGPECSAVPVPNTSTASG